MPGLTDFTWVHPCSWIGWGLASRECPQLGWLISVPHPTEGYSRLFHMAIAEGRRQKHVRPLRLRTRMGASCLGLHSIGESTVTRLAQIQREGAKIPPADGLSCKITLSMVWIEEVIGNCRHLCNQSTTSILEYFRSFKLYVCPQSISPLHI